MTTKNPSQTERYGELLTNEQRYQADIAVYEDAKDLTDEQEQVWIDRARVGDPDARETIITQLLMRVKRIASHCFYTYRWASHRIEYLDLVQEGNEEMLRSFEYGLQAEKPYAYLTAVARRAIYGYCLRLKGEAMGDEAIEVCSLDQPLFGEDGDLSALEVLTETLAITDDSVSEETSLKKYAPLYQAVHELAEKDVLVIVRSYGLSENYTWQLSEIEREQGWKYNAASSRKQKALFRLYRRLAPVYSHYVNDKGIPPLQSKGHHTPPSMTAEQEQRLTQAHAVLQARGEPLTAERLRQEARTGFAAARAYLQRYREHHPALDIREQRLDDAYVALKQEGRVSVEKLARLARVDYYIASLYLEHKGEGIAARPQLSIQERLEQAWQRLQERGEYISTNTLKREAHVNSDAVSAFLRQKRSLLAQETKAS